MRLAIDARESGTSTGRYVDKLLENLHSLKPSYEIIILTKSHRVNFFKQITPNFKAISCDFKEFTFSEQLGYLRQVNKLRAKLIHFAIIQQPILYKSKSITTMHDLTAIRFDNPTKNRVIYKFKQQVFKLVIKRVAKKSEHIITASEFVKKDLERFANLSPDKITVIYEAADKISAKAETVPRLKDQQFIMYVGRATPHKNLKRLVEAYIILRHKYPNLKLALAGKMDDNYRHLEKLVSRARLADKVVFTDFISEGQLRWMYQNTAAYVFPSLSEGFGLPGLEAMIHGAPVVSSSATCLPEIYGDAAIYFNPNDTKDMAKKIDSVLTDSNLRRSMVKSGRAQAAVYSWRKTAQQTLQIYERYVRD